MEKGDKLDSFKRIKPPKYRFGKYVLNEYEVRTIIAEVAEGKRKPGIKFKDSAGKIITILDGGQCDITPNGWDINAKLLRRYIKAQK